jgi:hypothetical protein
MLWEHGLTEIAVDQPPTLKQSNIYSVFAMRPARKLFHAGDRFVRLNRPR